MFMYSPQNTKFKQRPKHATINSRGSINTALIQQTKAGQDPGPILPPTTHLPGDLGKLLNLPCTVQTILLTTEIGKIEKTSY